MKTNSSHLGIAVLIILGLSFGSGCIGQEPEETDHITATIDAHFQLKINQTADIKSENLQIRFSGVTEDSRCASDVQCVWAGRATIAVTIFKNEQNLGLYSISTEGDAVAVVSFDTYTLRLVRLDPYPISTETIALSDYIATLLLSPA